MWDHPAPLALVTFGCENVRLRPMSRYRPADSALMADKPRDVQIAGKYLESFYLAGGGGRVVMLLAPPASMSSREVEIRGASARDSQLSFEVMSRSLPLYCRQLQLFYYSHSTSVFMTLSCFVIEILYFANLNL